MRTPKKNHGNSEAATVVSCLNHVQARLGSWDDRQRSGLWWIVLDSTANWTFKNGAALRGLTRELLRAESRFQVRKAYGEMVGPLAGSRSWYHCSILRRFRGVVWCDGADTAEIQGRWLGDDAGRSKEGSIRLLFEAFREQHICRTGCKTHCRASLPCSAAGAGFSALYSACSAIEQCTTGGPARAA